jgi:hypothetical protein
MRAGRRQRQAEFEAGVLQPGPQLAHGFFRQRCLRCDFGLRFKVIDAGDLVGIARYADAERGR